MNQAELDLFVANMQCCSAQKAAELVALRESGDLSYEQKLHELMAINNSIFALANYDITDDCLSETEICQIVENLRKLCNDCGC